MNKISRVSPECCSTLTSSLVCCKEIHEVSLNTNLGASMIDVSIHGILISTVQIDGGSSVNLMIVDTMEKLDLTKLLPTKLLLQMANHNKALPMDVLVNMETIIVMIVYKIDYINTIFIKLGVC